MDHRPRGKESRAGGNGSNSSLISLMWVGKPELSQELANQDCQIWLELSVSRGWKPKIGEDAMELDSAKNVIKSPLKGLPWWRSG